MKYLALALSATTLFGAGAALANTPEDAIEIATESGVCGEAPVKSATYSDANTITATCEYVSNLMPEADAATLLASGKF